MIAQNHRQVDPSKSGEGPGSATGGSTVVVGGHDIPEVLGAVVQYTWVAGWAGYAVAYEVIGCAVVGLKVDVVADDIAGVGITAGPAQVHLNVLTSGPIGGR